MRKNTTKNKFTLRVSSAETLQVFNDLLKTKYFESSNVLLNKIIDAGIQTFATIYLRKGVKTSLQGGENFADVDKKLKQILSVQEDVFTLLNIQERLLSTLHNIKVLELLGETVSADEVRSGMLSDLPEDFEAIKGKVVRSRVQRNSK